MVIGLAYWAVILPQRGQAWPLRNAATSGDPAQVPAGQPAADAV